jgi:hypothetical protein
MKKQINIYHYIQFNFIKEARHIYLQKLDVFGINSKIAFLNILNA